MEMEVDASDLAALTQLRAKDTAEPEFPQVETLQELAMVICAMLWWNGRVDKTLPHKMQQFFPLFPPMEQDTFDKLSRTKWLAAYKRLCEAQGAEGVEEWLAATTSESSGQTSNPRSRK